jgi:hypothetical protein
MKTYLTRSKSSLVVAVALMALPLWARPVAQITEVTGQAFVLTPDGKTRALKVNDHIEDKSELMVEDSGTLTIHDYFDATYHLTGGSHLQVFNKSVQLKKGKTWVQSQNTRNALDLTTANGYVNFFKSEFIVTFDQATARSQILVVGGDVEVSNVLDRNAKFAVPAGAFSLIDPDVNNGVPRAPTKVGLTSLNNAMAEFKRMPETLKNDVPARGIASVTSEAVANEGGPLAPKGEIIFIQTNRLPASVSGKAHEYFTKTANKKSKKKASQASAPINVYGMSTQASHAVPRGPASAPIFFKVTKKPAQNVILDQEFGDSLKRQQSAQPKHSKELESLIEDLKSY